MILVDDQSGSKDLFPYIAALTPNAILTRIDPPYGDITWISDGGPDGRNLRIGVEYKKIEEILGEIAGETNRFIGHQVEGLCLHYDRRYLLVEGRIRYDRNTGIMQKLKKDKWEDVYKAGQGFTYRDIQHWYGTVEEHAQFRVVETFDEYQSARWAFTKYTWWTAKGWNDHTALKQFHVPLPPAVSFSRPNLVRRWAKELDGIRWEKSIAIAAQFATPLEMALADQSRWMAIDGIGSTLSGRIVTAIRTGKELK